jgi:signal recognition particle subunit SRP54
MKRIFTMFDFLSQKFTSLFTLLENEQRLTESSVQDTLNNVQEALLEADVPYQVVRSFIQAVKEEVIGSKVIGSLQPAEQLLKIVQDKIELFLGDAVVMSHDQFPSVTMVMGLQGSGKTTTLGKFAYKMKKRAEQEGTPEKKIMLASVDFYRPAAIDQLEVLAQTVGVDFYRAQEKDPVMAAKEIYAHYQANKYDLLFLDTAGRLHVDNSMLQELQEIDALVQPRQKYFVLDAMTGQESLAIAKVFDDVVGFNGAVLTKMDSDTRGGAAFSFRYVLKKPIYFIGDGEGVADLSPFFPDRIAQRILGRGDLRSLIERAEEQLAFNEQQKTEEALKTGSFTLQDFADQMAMINQIGSLSQVFKYMPNFGVKVSPEMLQKGEVELTKFRAIIASMSLKERLNPSLLNDSRIERVAQGAGVEAKDVSLLLKRFEEAKQYVKLLHNKHGQL